MEISCAKNGRCIVKKFFLCIVVSLLAACGGDDFVQGDSFEDPRVIAWNTDISYGEMTDARNGKTYKTVKIGKQTWMAENLNLPMWGAYCVDYSIHDCGVYGLLYDWLTAVGRLDCDFEKSCALPSVVQGVCPDGWHLPSVEEWRILRDAVGGDSVAGTVLRSKNGWFLDKEFPGKDTYGFRAIPAGGRMLDLRDGYHFVNQYSTAFFWTSTEESEFYGTGIWINRSFTEMRGGKNEGRSVRCVENSEAFSPETTEHFEIPQYEPAEFETDSMTDSRDGQVYRTIVFARQTWMAENLNYRYMQKTAEFDSSSFCSNNSLDSCAKSGRYYFWSAAMDSAGIFSDDGIGCGVGLVCSPAEKVRGVCPEGWHLPDSTEWQDLIDAVGGVSVAGRVLKTQYAWKDVNNEDEDVNGTDDYGFSAYPANWISPNDITKLFTSTGSTAFFWSSSDREPNYACSFELRKAFESAFIPFLNKYYAANVRCVKDR